MKYVNTILLFAVSLLLAFSLFFHGSAPMKEVIKTDTITIVRIDTIRLKEPVYVYRRVVDTFRLITYQRDTVYLPIEQKRYEDSLYTAWVSGYRPRLDSIQIYSRNSIVYVSSEIHTNSKLKRWGIGVQTGYGFSKNGLTPFIGVGISYNLITF